MISVEPSLSPGSQITSPISCPKLTLQTATLPAWQTNGTSTIILSCFQGLRVTVLSGAAVMVAGAWLKVISLDPDSFWLAFLGHAVVGTAQVFILGVPAQLAAVWFGPSQVSTACALGVIGNQVTDAQLCLELRHRYPICLGGSRHVYLAFLWNPGRFPQPHIFPPSPLAN